MLLAHLHHRAQDVVPGLLFHHDVIGEHAAVPADVFDGFGEVALVVAEPVAGVFGDVEFAGGVVGHAVAGGLVVGAAAVDGAVVLGDVEVEHPGAEGGGESLEGLVELGLVLPVIALREDGILGGVVTHGVKQRMGHVGLEADRAGHVGVFEELHHAAPGVHAAPADLALGGDFLAVLLGDLAGFAKGVGDLVLVAFGVLVPVINS